MKIWLIAFGVINVAILAGLFYPKIEEYGHQKEKQENDEILYARLQKISKRLGTYEHVLPTYKDANKIHTYFLKKRLNDARVKILMNKMGKKVDVKIFPRKIIQSSAINNPSKKVYSFYKPIKYKIEADFTYKKLMKFLALLSTGKEFFVIKELDIGSFRKEDSDQLEGNIQQVNEIFLKAVIVIEFFASKKQEI